MAHEDPQEELQRRILDAAKDLFGQCGYQGTSLQEIAEKAGVSKPTVYKFFPSKAALYEQMVISVHQNYIRGLRQALSACATTREKLETYLTYQFDFATRHASLLKAFHSLLFLPEDVRPQINHSLLLEERFSELVKILEEGISRGDLHGDVTDMALALAGLGSLGVVQAFLPSIPILQQGLPKRLCELLWNGIGARQGRSGQGDEL